MIDARTCRAARAFLNWTSRQLAAKSGVPVSRIFELERDRPIGEADRGRLEAALLAHGAAIVSDGGRPVGVREAPAGGSPTVGSPGAVAMNALAEDARMRQNGPWVDGNDAHSS